MKSCISLFKNHQKCDSLSLDLKGIIDDKHYGEDINRSILITSTVSYKIAKESGIELEYGDLGENILVNFYPYDLASGAKLTIGEVVLEISQKSTLCRSLSKINSKLPKLLKDDRGIFAKVIRGGKINIGDNIIL